MSTSRRDQGPPRRRSGIPGPRCTADAKAGPHSGNPISTDMIAPPLVHFRRLSIFRKPQPRDSRWIGRFRQAFGDPFANHALCRLAERRIEQGRRSTSHDRMQHYVRDIHDSQGMTLPGLSNPCGSIALFIFFMRPSFPSAP